MKKDPDPFDERHPSRTDPECALGHALKVMFKKDNFMTKVCIYVPWWSRPKKKNSSKSSRECRKGLGQGMKTFLRKLILPSETHYIL